ncbi:Caffeyl-CoA reductase-Etf complex subunit CarD [subsurface metagenome]
MAVATKEKVEKLISVVVPIKQVPDMERVKFDAEKGTVDRSSAAAEINPFDLNALEAAVQVKDKLGGTVTTISMGPPQAESALRDALSRGADRAVLLVGREFAGADTLATSYTLASAIKKLGKFDLIICGEKTVDGDTGQVGPEIAEHLGIPHVAYVSKVEVAGGKLVVVCEMENDRYVIESELPLLITVTKDINTPRLPTLPDKLNARKAEIEKWAGEALSSVADPSKFGLKGSPTRLHKVIVRSEEGRKGEIFRGNPEETVAKLVDALEEGRVFQKIK